MAKMNTEKVANVFSKFWNPLRNLTKPQIERMLNAYHHGDDCRMQMVFSEIETQSPIYQVCIKKRTAGVLGREWDITPIDKSDAAKKQAEDVKKVFEKADTRNDDGLTDALRWLAMAAFRGRSAIKPFFTDDGELILKRLNNWNVLHYNGQFYWNPSSEEVGWFDTGKPVNCQYLPKDEICYLVDDMPVDVPGMLVYLRQLVGEDTWARFVEKQGIPQILITAPEGTPNTALDAWNYRAQQLYEGGSGTLPYGTNVHMLSEARGQDPFSEYIRHQMESVCIMALGGTLLAMPGATGLGSDLARVQQESFNSLVNQDCKRISNAVSNSIVPKIVKKLFGDNAETLCRFSFVEDDEYSAQDYLDMAIKANSIGLKIDAEEFKKATKLSFIQTDEVWSPTPQDESKEWSPEAKEELRKEMEGEAK